MENRGRQAENLLKTEIPDFSELVDKQIPKLFKLYLTLSQTTLKKIPKKSMGTQFLR
jgi:hypothetical protein